MGGCAVGRCGSAAVNVAPEGRLGSPAVVGMNLDVIFRLAVDRMNRTAPTNSAPRLFKLPGHFRRPPLVGHRVEPNKLAHSRTPNEGDGGHLEQPHFAADFPDRILAASQRNVTQ